MTVQQPVDRPFYDKSLFTVSGTEVNLISIILLAVIVLGSFLLSMIAQRMLKKALLERFVKREGTFYALLRLLHYVIIIFGGLIGLSIIGIELGTLFAAGAVFAIAIGFAMQNILQNFVSGVILLLERSIKPGDTLEIENKVVKVVNMGIRTTVVRTLREEELIIPNSVLSQSIVKNYTLRDDKFYILVQVGVSYSSDVDKVTEALKAAAMKMDYCKSEGQVKIRFRDFGNSSLLFDLMIMVDKPWDQLQYMSDLRYAIWYEFKEEDITIAFPQLDVHLDNKELASIFKGK